MPTENLKFFIERGFLLDKDMLKFFNELSDQSIADQILNKIKLISNERVITKSLIDKNIGKIQDIFFTLEDDKRKLVERYFLNLSLNIEIKKEKYIAPVKAADNVPRIISSTIFQKKKINVEDFVKHFRNRYIELKSILQERSELQNLTSIERINSQRQNISVIVMVSGKRTTKNKNILLNIEDLTGACIALINQNKPELYSKAQNIVMDEVIGLKCTGSREMLFVNDIIYPDAAIFEKKRSDSEVYALFTSDVHVGSDKFLEENFLRFIEWINGNINSKEDTSKIKYLFLVGDNVDGVGVYPGQESFLKINDIKKQYEKLAELLGMIRKDIKIILCPGQHDAVRVAEPQPAVGEDYAAALYRFPTLLL